MSARAGVRSVSQEQIHAAYSMGASRWQVIWHVVIPAAMPEILTAMRISIGFGWTTLVAAEMVAATVRPRPDGAQRVQLPAHRHRDHGHRRHRRRRLPVRPADALGRAPGRAVEGQGVGARTLPRLAPASPRGAYGCTPTRRRSSAAVDTGATLCHARRHDHTSALPALVERVRNTAAAADRASSIPAIAIRCSSPCPDNLQATCTPVLVGPGSAHRRRRRACGARPVAHRAGRHPGRAAAAAAQRAVALARDGEVRALIKGSLYPDDLMRAVAAPDSGLRGDRRLTHAFFVDVPGLSRGRSCCPTRCSTSRRISPPSATSCRTPSSSRRRSASPRRRSRPARPSKA